MEIKPSNSPLVYTPVIKPKITHSAVVWWSETITSCWRIQYRGDDVKLNRMRSYENSKPNAAGNPMITSITACPNDRLRLITSFEV